MAEISNTATASSLMVNVQPGAELKVVEYISELISASGEGKRTEAEVFAKACADLVGDADAPGLIRKLVGQVPLLLAAAQEEDKRDSAAGCFQMACNLLGKVEDAAQVAPLAEELAAALLAAPGQEEAAAAAGGGEEGEGEGRRRRPAQQLRAAAGLYNALPAGSAAARAVFLRLVAFADASGQLGALEAYVAGLGGGGGAAGGGLGLSPAERRRCLAPVVAALAARGAERAPDAQRLRLKLLATYEEEGALDADAPAAAAAAAAAALGGPLKELVRGAGALLRLRAVREGLAGHPEHGPLLELLRVFAAEDLAAYRAFVAKHPKVLGGYGLDGERLEAASRLLSLASLAAADEEVPHAQIAQSLQIPTEEVESWVVRAINAGLIEAKIDQLGETVMILRCAPRRFGRAEWEELDRKLGAWRKNVRHLLVGLRRSAEMAAQGRLPDPAGL